MTVPSATSHTEVESFSGGHEQRAKTCLIEAQSTVIARAMTSICNDEQVRLGVMSGHERKTLKLTVGKGLPAAHEDPPCALLRMAVGGQDLAVPIDDVHEILEVGRLTALPRTPDFVRGVMNLRGAVVPVIDLAARVGQPAITIGRRSCVVVVEAEPPSTAADEAAEAGEGGALVVGLLVDAVFEVFDAPASGMEPVPALGTRIAPAFLRGMTRNRGEVIGVLALDRVLAQQELGALIAQHLPH